MKNSNVNIKNQLIKMKEQNFLYQITSCRIQQSYGKHIFIFKAVAKEESKFGYAQSTQGLRISPKLQDFSKFKKTYLQLPQTESVFIDNLYKNILGLKYINKDKQTILRFIFDQDAICKKWEETIKKVIEQNKTNFNKKDERLQNPSINPQNYAAQNNKKSNSSILKIQESVHEKSNNLTEEQSIPQLKVSEQDLRQDIQRQLDIKGLVNMLCKRYKISKCEQKQKKKGTLAGKINQMQSKNVMKENNLMVKSKSEQNQESIKSSNDQTRITQKEKQQQQLFHDLSELKNKIKKYQADNNQYKSNHLIKEQQINKLKYQNKKIESQLSQLLETKNNQDDQLLKLKSENLCLQNRQDQLLETKNQQQKLIYELKNKKGQLQNNAIKQENSIKKLKQEKKQLENRQNQLLEIKTKQQKYIYNLNFEIQQFKKKQNQLQMKKNNQEKIIEKYSQEQRSLKQNQIQLLKTISRLQVQLKSQIKEKEDFKTQIKQVNRKNKQIETNSFNQINKLEKQLATKDKNLELCKKDIQKLKENIQFIQKEKQQKQKQKVWLSKQLDMTKYSLQKQIQQTKKQTKQKQKSIAEIGQLKNLRLQQMFEKDALTDKMNAKKFLTTSIQNFIRSEIRFTRLLYAYHPQNKANFHKFFDKTPNLCIVIRTITGHLLAGFTSKPFIPNTSVLDSGLLISLTKNQSYPSIKNKRAITYDEFYLTFGNDQIRILTNDKYLYSNFGISNGFYENKGDSLQDFIGACNDNTVEMAAYEIYQVVFN